MVSTSSWATGKFKVTLSVPIFDAMRVKFDGQVGAAESGSSVKGLVSG